MHLSVGCACIRRNLSFGNRSAQIEVKTGYFFFTQSRMKDVYDQGGIDFQVSGTYPIHSFLNVYGSVEYLEKSGHSLGLHQKTSIWEIPLSLGLQLIYTISCAPCIRNYFTLGPRYIFSHAHNRSSYVPSNMNTNGIGGFANTGLIFNVNRHLIIDLYGEYSYAMICFHKSKPRTYTHRVQLGGLAFGGGVGYMF
jgi:hypothetical protein